MTSISKTSGNEGLRFFGKMTASISHELKNVLAVINENAGLMEDFALMAQKGKPIDPERIKGLAGKIISQVRRGDGIITNMNRFAHSVDEEKKRFNLNELLDLMVALSGRFASMRGVSLKRTSSEIPVLIHTNEYDLQNLVWRCLDFAMNGAGQKSEILVASEKTDDGVRIRVSAAGGFSGECCSDFPGRTEKDLTAALICTLYVDSTLGEILLTLPAGISPEEK